MFFTALHLLPVLEDFEGDEDGAGAGDVGPGVHPPHLGLVVGERATLVRLMSLRMARVTLMMFWTLAISNSGVSRASLFKP